MVAEESKIVRSVRANKEVFARIQDISKEKGMDQGATLEALINAWDIQNAKGLVPERAADIADFDSAIQRIQSAFLRSLELATGAESRARNAYAAQLDAMSNEIARLKTELTEARETADSAQYELAQALKQTAELKKANEYLREQSQIAAILTTLSQKLEEAPKAEKPKGKRGAKPETAETIDFPKEAQA